MSIDSLKIDSLYLQEIKQTILTRAIPWEGLLRTDTISSTETDSMKKLGNQNTNAERAHVVKGEIDVYATVLISILNKVNRDDVIKNVLVLINDFLFDVDGFVDALLKLRGVDSSLPFSPFVNFLKDSGDAIRVLSLCNLSILLTHNNYETPDNNGDVLDVVFDMLSTKFTSSGNLDLNFISVQVLKDLVVDKHHRSIYWSNESKNFTSLLNLLKTGKGDLQFKYNVLLVIWILTFEKKIVDDISLKYPELVSLLLNFAKNSIREKLVRLSIGILVNLIKYQQHKIVKLIIINDGLNNIKFLNERKWSDIELKQDLSNLIDELNSYVIKMSSFDEYLTELDSGLFSWSPAHKSVEFWLENSIKFKENSWFYLKKLLNFLKTENGKVKNYIIILNDLQFLINNLKLDLINYLNSNGFKLIIMQFMNSEDNELKYEALKTTQLLVTHSFK